MRSWCKNTARVLVLVYLTFVWFFGFLVLLDVLRIATERYYFLNDLDGILYRLHLIRFCVFALVSLWWFCYFEVARSIVLTCHFDKCTQKVACD